MSGICNKSSQVKLKILILKSSLCNSDNLYILVKETITVAANTAAAPDRNDKKKIIFANIALFTDCINQRNTTHVDNTTGLDAIMPVYNLLKYRNSSSKMSGRLCKYCKDKKIMSWKIQNYLNLDWNFVVETSFY